MLVADSLFFHARLRFFLFLEVLLYVSLIARLFCRDFLWRYYAAVVKIGIAQLHYADWQLRVGMLAGDKFQH